MSPALMSPEVARDARTDGYITRCREMLAATAEAQRSREMLAATAEVQRCREMLAATAEAQRCHEKLATTLEWLQNTITFIVLIIILIPTGARAPGRGR